MSGITNRGHLLFLNDDGGRAAAGFKGSAGDCVTRSIAIATAQPYREVYDRLAEGNANQRLSTLQRKKKARTAAEGINVQRKWFKDYMAELGFVWQPTMGIGTGCRVHLTSSELPRLGAHVLALSRHYAAWVDGVLHDTYDCSREGTRCVYGYWTLKGGRS